MAVRPRPPAPGLQDQVFGPRLSGGVGRRVREEPPSGPGARRSFQRQRARLSGERAKLIGLAAYARKAHFQYNQETGLYLMESLVEIPNFLKTTLPLWRRVFAVELDDKAANLLKGTRSVEIEAVAERGPGRRPGRGGPQPEVDLPGRRAALDRWGGFGAAQARRPAGDPSQSRDRLAFRREDGNRTAPGRGISRRPTATRAGRFRRIWFFRFSATRG